MLRSRRRVVVACVTVVTASAIAVAGYRAYEATWASSDQVIDDLDLPRLGAVTYREHNNFLSIDIAPNTTAELEPRAGESIADLHAAVTRRMGMLGYTFYPFDRDADYVHWLHSPSADQHFGAHGASVLVTVTSTSSRGGDDTDGLHRTDHPVIRFAASTD